MEESQKIIIRDKIDIYLKVTFSIITLREVILKKEKDQFLEFSDKYYQSLNKENQIDN